MSYSLLNPSEEEIEFWVKISNEYENLLYERCIDKVKDISLCDISKENFGEVLRVFLIKWGRMGRVLNRNDKKGWEDRVIKRIKDLCETFEFFKKYDLKTVDLNRELEDKIIECYREIKNTGIGPTSTSKVLHLLCPNFFPLWDWKIREKFMKELNSKDSEENLYFKFIQEVKRMLNKYDIILKNLKEKYHKSSELKILDDFIWSFCNRKKDKKILDECKK